MIKKNIAFYLLIVLIIPAIFMLSACGDNKTPQNPSEDGTETAKVYSEFVFDENKFVGYIGTDTEIVIPSSYSVRNTNSDIYTINYNIQDIINYGDESSLDYEIWAENLSNFDRYILVGGMYNVSVNGGEKHYIRVGEAEDYFTLIKETYTDLQSIISVELTDYTLTSEDKIDESNFTIITRPFIEMLSGKLESFTMNYDNKVINFTKENYLQNYNVFSEIFSAGSLSGDIVYDIGNYVEFIEGNDFNVETISSIVPDQVLGGGLFNTPNLNTITISSAVKTISDGVFEGLDSLTTVIIESEDVYNALTDINSCGGLISNATNIKVLKSVVDNTNNVNAYLNSSDEYIKSEEENYYNYSK